jgi:hypothetical protein
MKVNAVKERSNALKPTNTREKYETPKLEVRRLRDLPSALASSGCRVSPSHGMSCSVSGTGGHTGN